jgi:hypothetical protein
MTIHNPVGAGLARESGVSADADAGCADAFAGKPGSYHFRVKPQTLSLTQNLVGASLLAKAMAHSASL